MTSADALRPVPTAIGLIAGIGVVTAAAGWWVLPFLGAATVGAAAVVWLARRKIGGIAGDVLGAVEQVVECLVMVVAAGLAERYAVWW